jgi:hypothetical protein
MRPYSVSRSLTTDDIDKARRPTTPRHEAPASSRTSHSFPCAHPPNPTIPFRGLRAACLLRSMESPYTAAVVPISFISPQRLFLPMIRHQM